MMGKRVLIIGGGISGLSVAYRLKKAGVEPVLFEGGTAVGGNIRTEKRDGFLIEHGPNSTLASPEFFELLKDLNLVDQIAPPDANAKKRFVLRNGRPIALPSGPTSLITTDVFSTAAKFRLLKEPFVPAETSEDESVASFFERRLGKEIVDYAVDPFVSGIYAGDPERLSIRYAFPRLFEMERQHGSMLKGGMRSKKNAAAPKVPKGTPRSITFKDGMQTLSDALLENLRDSIRYSTKVHSISRTEQQAYRVQTENGEEDFDAIVICTPAHVAARIVDGLDSECATALSNVFYPPVTVVYTGFRREDVKFDPQGFGFLVPGSEGRRILGSLWTSSVFENRAPDGYHLFTTFIGGSRRAELCNNTEDVLLRIALEELDSILGISGEPAFTAIKKWPRAIPQYNLGYGKTLAAIEKFQNENPGIFFCSNFYKGISVSDCVKNSAAAADSVLSL